MLCVVASVTVNLPPGISQALHACSVGLACTYKHSEGGSALNRIRLIISAKRRRLLLLPQTPPRAAAATHTSTPGTLTEFDCGKGCGWITPKKLAKGATVRRQRVFFHKSEWKV